ncbi:glutamate racemase [Sporolactobacillus sp. CPB3-1]|uniref:Glutamate racemase n=1 Tax=Sporolactobacillus mangiferae TaxID=2940498 RepID=A0ABT0M9E3_9BACL|nr:glutamate racemase [Sporolactobacillus mangiferae]MCL1631503.1 glutamate racemase [Sporolactobacillus mangiferae]
MNIAVFDSGIGGMTVLHQIKKLMPNEDYLYYADTAHLPYGEKSKEQLKSYIFEAAEFLMARDIKALVIACNTATSAAIEDLRKTYTLPIIGIEPAVKPAVIESESEMKKVLVMATRLTLKEEKYHRLVERIDKHDIVDGLPMPGLVTFAEAFNFNPDDVVSYIKEQLKPFDLAQYGTVVLGCTHFPIFKDMIRQLFPKETHVIDGSMGTAMNLKRILENLHQVGGGSGKVTYYKSGVEVSDRETLTHYETLMNRLSHML